MEYISLNNYLRTIYNQKIYKISLDGGFTCPNRDGSIDTRGCIFCLEGSGAFAQDRNESITNQIENGKRLVSDKASDKYIAYFQSYTGTYGDIDVLRNKYLEAVEHPDIVVLSIATRPDCLSDSVLEVLRVINTIKPVWVELGLQTIHPETAQFIRRGFALDVYDEAVKKLTSIGIKVITHMIIGLPGETTEMIIDTARYIGESGAWGIKIQLLHILEGTDLALSYRAGDVSVLSLEEYTSIVIDCLRVLPEEMVVHRITGDGDKKHMLAPLWSGDKKHVLNHMNKQIAMAER